MAVGRSNLAKGIDVGIGTGIFMIMSKIAKSILGLV